MNNSTADPVLLSESSGTVTTLTLNRPKARNCLSIELLEALNVAIQKIGKEMDISAIIIAANGPAFCSGHDLKELTAARANTDNGAAFFNKTMRLCAELMQSIVLCPKPVIAVVQGVATAAGCQLVASCDLAVASTSATFSTPGVHIGLFCSTPMVALSRNIPRKRTMEMLLLGEMTTAQQAADWGLVNRVAPAEQIMGEAISMATKIAAKSAVTVAIGKAAFYQQIEQNLSSAYDYAAGVMVDNMLIEDAEEGIGAFLEKRAPEWQHK